MKIIGKKYIAVIIALIVAFSAVSVSLSTFAADDGYGTEEEGIIDTVPRLKPILNNFDNLDFSKGYKYWGSACNQPNQVSSTKPTIVSSLNKDKGGNQLTLKYDSQNTWRGIKTVKFYVDSSKINVGDKLTALVEWKGNVYFTVGLSQWELGSDGKESNALTCDRVKNTIVSASSTNEWNVSYIPYSNASCVVKEDYTPDDGKYVLQISVQTYGATPNAVTGDTVTIRNIRIVKPKDGKYYDFDGNEVDPSANLTPSEPDPPGPDPEPGDNSYGDAENGITDALPSAKTPLNSFNNLDFSQGYKYWGSSCSNIKQLPDQLPNKITSLKYDSAGNQLTLKYNENYKWQGISTVKFYVDGNKVSTGDKITVLSEWKGNLPCQISITQYDLEKPKTLAGNDITATSQIVHGPSKNDGWNLSASRVVSTNLVAADTTDDGKILIGIGIQAYGTTAQADSQIILRNLKLVKIVNGNYYDLDGNRVSTGDDDSELYYGTEAEGITDAYVKGMPTISKPLNFDFSQGFRYWGSSIMSDKMANALPTTVAKIEEENGNKYLTLNPVEGLSWAGVTTVPFYVEGLASGTRLSVLYDWRGDGNVQVAMSQLDLVEDPTGRDKSYIKCSSTPVQNLVISPETDDGWYTSWQYVNYPVKDDTTNDGKCRFIITIQPNGNNNVTTSFDNLRLVVIGQDNKTVYDLNGKIISFGDEDNNPGDDDDGYDGDEDNNNNNNSDNNTANPDTAPSDANNNNSDNKGGNNNSASGNNSTQDGTGYNSGSTGGNNSYNNNTGNGTGTSQATEQSYDLNDILANLEKLKSGEELKFIPLISVGNSYKGNANAYISVNSLSAKEEKALLSLTGEQINNYLTVQSAILKTLTLTPDSDNVKAFKKIGGKPANTIPLSFTGHINFDFMINVRINLGNAAVDTGKTYYVYHCNPDTRVIENLGKARFEEQNGEIFVTFRTNSFSDFFISPQNLEKAALLAGETVNETSTSPILIIGLIAGGAVILAAATVLTVLLIKRKKAKVL